LLTPESVVHTLGGDKFAGDLVGSPTAIFNWDGQRITVGHVQFEEARRGVAVAVHLDDGSVLRVCRDQEFLLRDGARCLVTDLQPGTSLLPLYLSADHHGYLSYVEPGEWHRGGLTRQDRQRRRRVARMVAEWKLKRRVQPGDQIRQPEGRLICDPAHVHVSHKPRKQQKRIDPVFRLLREAKKLMNPNNHKVTQVQDGNCMAAGSKVYVVQQSVIIPTPIEVLAAEGEGFDILAWDAEAKVIKTTPAVNPRLTKAVEVVIRVPLTNGKILHCTREHRLLTVDGWKEAQEMEKGDLLIGLRNGVDLDGKSVFTANAAGTAWVTAAPSVAPEAVRVFDITTEFENFVCDGVVVHNSTSFLSIKELDTVSFASGGVFLTPGSVE